MHTTCELSGYETIITQEECNRAAAALGKLGRYQNAGLPVTIKQVTGQPGSICVYDTYAHAFDDEKLFLRNEKCGFRISGSNEYGDNRGIGYECLCKKVKATPTTTCSPGKYCWTESEKPYAKTIDTFYTRLESCNETSLKNILTKENCQKAATYLDIPYVEGTLNTYNGYYNGWASVLTRGCLILLEGGLFGGHINYIQNDQVIWNPQKYSALPGGYKNCDSNQVTAVDSNGNQRLQCVCKKTEQVFDNQKTSVVISNMAYSNITVNQTMPEAKCYDHPQCIYTSRDALANPGSCLCGTKDQYVTIHSILIIFVTGRMRRTGLHTMKITCTSLGVRQSLGMALLI